MKRVLLVFVILFGGVAITLSNAGCGSSVIDNEKVSQEVESDLGQSLEISVRSVACPSGVPVKPHSRFVCSVDVGIEEFDAILEVLNSDADVRLAAVRRHGE